eukprot:15476706-Alexandrium_andersonii.AAC.1
MPGRQKFERTSKGRPPPLLIRLSGPSAAPALPFAGAPEDARQVCDAPAAPAAPSSEPPGCGVALGQAIRQRARTLLDPS